MRIREIDFRHLLREILPLDRLPSGIGHRAAEALASGDPEALEAAALEAIAALERSGVLRPEEAPEGGGRRYLNVLTGARIAVRPRPVEPGTITLVPIPVPPGAAAARLDAARDLLALAGRVLSEDGTRVAEKEQLIELLLSFTRQMLGCDEARYLSLEADARDGFVAAGESGSPFAAALADEWGPARGHLLLIRELEPERRGEAGHVTGAAIRIGQPGDRVRGAIEVWSSTPGWFTAERLALLELIAGTGRGLLANISRLEDLVFIDSRTQIFNKSFFEIQFRNFVARARREGRQMAIAIIDVDDFKSFNSRYGYAGGDQVLYRVAQLLKGQVRPFDCVARWGGEEFAVVLAPPVEPEDARTICDRLRRAIQESTFQIPGLDGKEHRASVTVSVGGALFPGDAGSFEDLWRRANEALLTAKSEGKNRVHFRPPGGGRA